MQRDRLHPTNIQLMIMLAPQQQTTIYTACQNATPARFGTFYTIEVSMLTKMRIFIPIPSPRVAKIPVMLPDEDGKAWTAEEVRELRCPH